MKKIIAVFGTRPEALKMCPLIRELVSRNVFDVKTVFSGQHRETVKQTFGIFETFPDYDLNIMKPKQTLSDIISGVINGLTPVLNIERPDIVLVHGDTSTALATALLCYHMHIPVGHVEAGLRSGDLSSPFPEEFNRRSISAVSSIDFAPTFDARINLLSEGKNPDSVFVTGNTVIDALATTLKDGYSDSLLDWSMGFRLVLLTAHRRENLGYPMRQMLRAVREAVDRNPECKVVYPVHPNPAVRTIAENELGDCTRIILTEPLEAVRFHNILARSYLVITDSGGIQEEATYLGKPVLVMRDKTERPEGIRTGNLILTGTSGERIPDIISRLLRDSDAYESMSVPSKVYGDGKASKRIADILEKKLK